MTDSNSFSDSLLNPKEFTITYELVPGQGSGGKRVDGLLEFARQAGEDGRIKALSITDNPGGNPALAPVAIGSEIQQIGIEPLIHFSMKDKNRNQIFSHVYLYQRLGIRSLLVLGGDFPSPGYYGQARPVFDLDTIQALRLMDDLESGRYPAKAKKKELLTGESLFKGCVVSPFKTTESEQVWQYVKLLHKVRAGADFIVSQLGYDLRKFSELITFIRKKSIDLPVLANVFIPSLPVAKFMATGRVPGVLISKKLIQQMEDEQASGNKQARLDRGAAMIAQLKKVGFQGVHLGGNNLNFSDIGYMLDRVADHEKQQGEPAKEGYDFPIRNSWYLYPIHASGTMPQAKRLQPGTIPGSAPVHALSHDLLFTERLVTGRIFAKFCLFCEGKKYRTSLLTWLERFIKRLLFNCRMCGECTLEQAGYLCSQSGCPKRLVNGPCGGSRKGFCEVFPDRLCFWVRVYGRLDRKTGLITLIERTPLPPKNWALQKTSSWINHFRRESCLNSKGKVRAKE